MKLRKINFDDWEILLEWRNDDITRKNSIIHDVVSEESHKIWLKNILIDSNKEFFILEDNSFLIGTIRSDKNGEDEYTLSWTISPSYRKKGYGVEILKLFLENKKGKFIAKIISTNIGSIKMAERNGFELIDNENIDNNILLTYFKQI